MGDRHTTGPWRISSTPKSPRLRPKQIRKYFSISPDLQQVKRTRGRNRSGSATGRLGHPEAEIACTPIILRFPDFISGILPAA